MNLILNSFLLLFGLKLAFFVAVLKNVYHAKVGLNQTKPKRMYTRNCMLLHMVLYGVFDFVQQNLGLVEGRTLNLIQPHFFSPPHILLSLMFVQSIHKYGCLRSNAINDFVVSL